MFKISYLLLSLSTCLWAGARQVSEIPPVSAISAPPSSDAKIHLTAEEQQWLSIHDGHIRIGITVIPPQVMEVSGDYRGLSIDYIRLLERKLGCKFKLVPYATWDEILQAAKDRRIDMIFAAQQTPERSNYLLFSQPYIELANMILVRQDRRGGSNLKELKGWKVAVSRGSAVHESLRHNHPQMDLHPVPDEVTGLAKVSMGEVDAMVLEVSRASYYIEKMGILNLRVSGQADIPYQLRFAVRSDWPTLQVVLDKGLSMITAEVRRSIHRKWVFVSDRSLFDSQVFWISSIGALVAIVLVGLGVTLWNKSLRKLVRLRTSQMEQQVAERKLAEEALKDDLKRLRALLRILHHDAKDRQKLLDYALDEAIRLTGSRIGYIYLYDEERQQFVLNSWSRDVMAECAVVDPQTRYDLSQTGVWGEAVRQRCPIILNDYPAQHPLKKGYPEGHVHLKKFMTVPIFVGHRIVATVGLADKETDYNERDIIQLRLLMEGVWHSVTLMETLETLAASEKRYSGLFNTIQEGFSIHEIITDEAGRPADYRFLDVNPAFETMTGLPRKRWVGHTVKEVLPGIEHAWIEAYGRVALTGEPSHFEAYAAQLGRWFQVHAFCSAPGQFAVLSFDITERKKTELALLDMTQRLSLAVASGRLGIWEMDLATAQMTWNDEMYCLYGCSREKDEVLVQLWSDSLHPEDAPFAREAYAAALQGEREFDPEFRIICPDGTTKFIKANAVVIRDDDGSPLRVIGLNRDITEQKDAEASLAAFNATLEQRVKDRTAQLEAANRELEAFSYSVSHDLRGPLRGIDGFSRALAEDYGSRLDEDGLHYISRIRAGAQRMGQLIDDLLRLSRISRSSLMPVELDLAELASEILAGLTRAAPGRPFAFSIQPELIVQADRRLMLLALENLLGNAWKFTARCSEVHIAMGETLSPTGERSFFVRDNGVGFDMAYVDKLFKAFQRLHLVSEFEGTGIGLAITQRVIHCHGGRIWAEATPDKGSTFFFTLPGVGDLR